MVTVDLDIKQVVGLADSNSLTKDQLKDYLDKFKKEDFIAYLVELMFPKEESEKKQTEDIDF